MPRSCLEEARIARRDQADTSPASDCRGDAARSSVKQPLRLPRHGLAVFNQRHVEAHQRLQMLAHERVVRAAQHQCVDLPGFSAKQAHSRHINCADSYDFCSAKQAGAAFDGVCQAVAGLQHKLRNACLRGQQYWVRSCNNAFV